MNPLSNKLALVLGLLLSGFLCAAQAEKADHDKPLHIESNSLNVDDAKHISTFNGKVELTQGTLRVTAEKIVVTQDAAGNQFCVATGKLASFRQKREAVNEFVEGYGERIEYNSLTGTVDFYVHARVKRDRDDVRGDHITYSTQTEIFHVGGRADSKNPENTRVHATIQPKNKSPQEASPNATPLGDNPSPVQSDNLKNHE